jgi:hypothetical protein
MLESREKSYRQNVSSKVQNLSAPLMNEVGFCGAGVSPANFPLAMRHKIAGGTPAPQKARIPS